MGWLLKSAVFTALLAVGLYALKVYIRGCFCHIHDSLEGQTVVVTGANTGLGKGCVEELVGRGARVVMACRNMEKCDRARRDVINTTGASPDLLVTRHLDLERLPSVRDFAQQLLAEEKSIHILINNAGVWPSHKYQQTDEGLELSFGVNHLGHFLLTNLLLERVKASAPSRIINVSSRAHYKAVLYDQGWAQKNDENYNGHQAYRDSKLMNVMFTKALAERLEGTGVVTYSVCPGPVVTELLRNFPDWLQSILYTITPVIEPFLKTAVEGAQVVVCCAVDPALSTQRGLYYHHCSRKSPNPLVENRDLVEKLWRDSERLADLPSPSDTLGVDDEPLEVEIVASNAQ